MSVANRPVHRPLSPHLQVYKLAAHFGAVDPASRDRHRARGRRALSAVWVIVRGGRARSAYAMFQGFNTSIVGRIVLGGWLFCAFYHLCNGIRHLFWDAGYGFELKDAYRSGWIVVGVSLIATVAVVDRRPQADLREADMDDRRTPLARARGLGSAKDGAASLVGAAPHRHRADPARRVVRHLAGHAERRRLCRSCAPGSARRWSWCC